MAKKSKQRISTKKEGTPDKKGKVAVRTVVHFAASVNYIEVAAILIQHLEKAFIQSPELALNFAGEEAILDPVHFGEELSLIFTEEDIAELLPLDIGPGLILGMYLAKKEFEYAEERSEADIAREAEPDF